MRKILIATDSCSDLKKEIRERYNIEYLRMNTVKDGEDITGISIEHDISPSEIRQLNNLPPEAQVTAGMQLKLPASTL